MTGMIEPKDEKSLVQLIRWAAAEEKPIELLGAGTKRALGRPVEATLALRLGGIAGIEDYQPEELVVSVRAGTRIADLDLALGQRGQMLPFEPGDWGPLLGAPARGATIGGVVGCNLSGPRRIKAGAARDHVLGIKGVSGRGEVFKAGGYVVKNVTGYDLPKLMTGSYGTLAALTEITLKVLPKPEKTRTLLAFGLDDDAAIRLLCAVAGSPHEVSGLAHLPHGVARRSRVAYVSGAGKATTAIRIEGPAPSVAVRLEALKAIAGKLGALEELHGSNSAALWSEIANGAFFAADDAAQIWRLSVAPTDGPKATALVRAALPGAEAYFDWSGGLVWLAVPPSSDARAQTVRGALGGLDGYATLIRASATTRQSVAVFQPEPSALAALSRRVKEAFDPKNVLNPGRMTAGT
jgi:glycolate oxidase FAD binding subunit